MPLLPGSLSRCPSRIKSFRSSEHIIFQAQPCSYTDFVLDLQGKEAECLFDDRLVESKGWVYNICLYSRSLMHDC